MPIAFASLGTISGTTTNATSYYGPSGSVTAGDLLICGVSAANTVAAGTMTGGGLTWTRLTSFTKNAAADTIYVFWASSPTTQGLAVTFDCTGDAAAGCCIFCYKVTGGEGQTVPAIRQFITNTGSVANPSGVMLAAVLSGNGVIGFAANGTNSATQWTSPTNWTEGGEASYTTTAQSFQACSYISETRTTIPWTNANVTAWGVIILELWQPHTRSVSAGASYSSPMFY